MLERDGCALDAVEAAVTLLEDDALFNAGRGAVLTLEGNVELDASIMDGERLRAGAVAAVTCVRNPVRLARRVLEDTPHVFLVGHGAEHFADEIGMVRVPNAYFITPERAQQLAALHGATAGSRAWRSGRCSRRAMTRRSAPWVRWPATARADSRRPPRPAA